MIKKALKRQTQKVIAKLGRQNWNLPRPALLILMYHRILPVHHPQLAITQPGMVVYPETFRMHVRTLKGHFQLIHLTDWLRRRANGLPVPARACTLTFDDGWRDNFEWAFPILQSEEAPATIFVVSDKVGTQQAFWPERLARLLWQEGRGLPPGVTDASEFHWLREIGAARPFSEGVPNRDQIDYLIERAKQYSDSDLDNKLRELERLLGHTSSTESPDLLDWSQLAGMAKSGLVRIGSHTRNHTRLSGLLDHDAVEHEIKGSKDKIEQVLGCDVDLFCYPNGETTALAETLVQEHYAGACTTDRGWNTGKVSPYKLKRIGIHQDIAFDRTSFLARLSGWI